MSPKFEVIQGGRRRGEPPPPEPSPIEKRADVLRRMGRARRFHVAWMFANACGFGLPIIVLLERALRVGLEEHQYRAVAGLLVVAFIAAAAAIAWESFRFTDKMRRLQKELEGL